MAALWAWALLLGLLCCGGTPALAQPGAEQPGPPAIVLRDGGESPGGALPGWQWIDPSGRTSLAQVLSAPPAFGPLRSDAIQALGASGALWFRLRLARPAGSHMEWLAELPLPPLDAVTLYQQDSTGAWRGQNAGDKYPVASWPEPGRFPVFRLEVPPGEVRDVYFRIQHNARSSIPLRIASAAEHSQRQQLAYLGLGLVFGGLALLIAACLAQSWVYRDSAFFGYAAYASTMALAMAAYSGAGAHLLWPHSGVFADAAQGGLGILSGAAAILFVRNLSGIAPLMPRLASLARWSAFAAPLLLLAYVLVDRPIGVVVLGIYLVLVCAINLLVAWLAWRRGDQVSLWIVAAYVPLAAAVALTLMRVFGLAPTSWINQYGVVAAMALQVPLLLVALSVRSRERHGARTRELALSTQDALTGLLAPHLFHDRLRQVLARHQRGSESAAVLFIDLANYPRIREQHGSAVAEQSLLRSVIKLRRLLRDIDTLSRIGESRFGVILERMDSRVAVTDRAARLVAAGMMPAAGQKPEVTLQFHIAAALLHELTMDAPELTAALAELLQSMSQDTGRPIRFVRIVTVPTGLESPRWDSDDSALPLPEQPSPA